MVKVFGVKADDMGFVQSIALLLASSCNSAGEQVLGWAIHKIVLIKEVEVWFPHEEIWCQDELTTWGEPVVIDFKKEKHCFLPNEGNTCLGWLAHLVSRFACNTRVIVNASSSSLDSCLKLLSQKPRIKSSTKQTKINITSSINQMVIQWGGKSHRVAVW